MERAWTVLDEPNRGTGEFSGVGEHVDACLDHLESRAAASGVDDSSGPLRQDIPASRLNPTAETCEEEKRRRQAIKDFPIAMHIAGQCAQQLAESWRAQSARAALDSIDRGENSAPALEAFLRLPHAAISSSHIIRKPWHEMSNSYSRTRRLLRAVFAAHEKQGDSALKLDFELDGKQHMSWLPVFDTVAQASGYPLQWLLSIFWRVCIAFRTAGPANRRARHGALNRRVLRSFIRRLRNWIRGEGGPALSEDALSEYLFPVSDRIPSSCLRSSMMQGVSHEH